MSDIRFNQWLHQSGTGGVSQDHIGNIGIGTTNPSIVVSAANTAVLNVGVITANNLFVNNAFNGDITGNVTGNISGATGTFSGNVDIADKIIHTGDTDTAMRFPADNTFAVDTAGSERLRITSDGKVAIGFNAPAVAGLSISNSSTNRGFEFDTGSGFDSTSCIRAYDRPTTAYKSLGLTGSDIRFAINDVEKVRITSDGRVGVNCTPLSPFQVKGGTNANIALTTMSSEAAIEAFNDAGSANVPLRLRASAHKFFIGSTEGLRVHTNGLIGVGYDSPTAYGRMTVAMPSQSGGAAIQVANSSNGSGDGTTSNIVLRSVNNSGSNWADAEYRASEHIFAIQGTERMRINANGYVTKPNQPRFWARLSTDQTGYDGRNVGGSWITYDTEEYDIGGNFATSGADQGRFIAPVAGLYLFQAVAYKQTGTADWSQSWFDVDGSRKNGTDWVVDASRFAQNSIQIYLTAGQKIGFHPYNNASSNTILDSQNHTWFKGCLLG